MTLYRPLVLPIVMTLIGLAVLVSLGKWQLDRREWKLGLIERIDTRAHGEPISLSAAKEKWERNQDVEYYRVRLGGHFLHEHERYLYTIVDGQAGWRVLTPFETPRGDIIFVDRGFVPEALKDPAARREGQIEGRVELVGLARAPERQGLFTPDNQPGANRWFWRDLAGLIASLPPEPARKALPFMVEAERMPVPGGWPRSGVTRLSLPNRHLEYAITWFGLAAALIAIFALYARRRLSQPGQSEYEASIADKGGSV